LVFSKLIDKFRGTGNKSAGLARAVGETEKEPVPESGMTNRDQRNEREPLMRKQRIKLDLLIHDLKVPLAVIDAGITALLKKQEKYGPVNEKQEKVLQRTLRNTKVTQMLVNDALELGRSREGIVNLTNFTLSSLVEQALVEIFDLIDTSASEEIRSCTRLGSLRKTLGEKGLTLIVDDNLWCQEFCMDEGKVTQILRNLLSNALKYRKSSVELEVDKKDEWIVFSVKDDGEGIPATHHEKIFESYFQMSATDRCPIRGHGLGLAGVMVLVEDMGGKLYLESDEGRGAKFFVEVPLKN
jgi:two-component system OmpR family sensor kinase